MDRVLLHKTRSLHIELMKHKTNSTELLVEAELLYLTSIDTLLATTLQVLFTHNQSEKEVNKTFIVISESHPSTVMIYYCNEDASWMWTQSSGPGIPLLACLPPASRHPHPPKISSPSSRTPEPSEDPNRFTCDNKALSKSHLPSSETWGSSRLNRISFLLTVYQSQLISIVLRYPQHIRVRMGTTEMGRSAVKEMLNRGEFGLDGLHPTS